MTHGHARPRYRTSGIAVRSGKEWDAEFLSGLDASHGHTNGEGMSVRFGLEGVSLWIYFTEGADYI
jgi:hypothetical protein